jgi:hypothetical protein
MSCRVHVGACSCAAKLALVQSQAADAAPLPAGTIDRPTDRCPLSALCRGGAHARVRCWSWCCCRALCAASLTNLLFFLSVGVMISFVRFCHHHHHHHHHQRHHQHQNQHQHHYGTGPAPAIGRADAELPSDAAGISAVLGRLAHARAAQVGELSDEEQKRQRWAIESVRRKHNYIPFIFSTRHLLLVFPSLTLSCCRCTLRACVCSIGGEGVPSGPRFSLRKEAQERERGCAHHESKMHRACRFVCV